jgi:hypothetical protein
MTYSQKKMPQRYSDFIFRSEIRNCRKKPPARSHLISSLNALRAALFVLLALGHNGGAKTAAEIIGQFVKLGVTVNLDGFLGGIADNIAVVAPGEMVL